MNNDATFELMNVKGGNDYLPEVLITRNRVINILKTHFERFGYLPLETTMLCYKDLLSYKYAGGAEIMKEVYSLTDQGGRELGLRYDLTVPFCKVIGMNKNIRMPFKRYEIGKVFRDGPVKLGRCREFYQCDIDAVGLNGQEIEAELMNLAVVAYTEIGIDLEIRYSNRKFLTGVIAHCGFKDELCSAIVLEVDKLEKTSRNSVIKEISRVTGSNDTQKAELLLDYLFTPIEELTEKLVDVEEVKEGLTQLVNLHNILNTLGISQYCRFVPSLARGLEIYTGTVWEVFDKKGGISSSLGGGGRYDKIISDFMDDGRVYPAVGMSFGLEPICTVLNLQKQQVENTVNLFIIPLSTSMQSMAIANRLREKGVNVLVEMSGKKLNKSFSYANNEKIPYVLVLGENECESGVINIKDMNSGETKEFNINDVDVIAAHITQSS